MNIDFNHIPPFYTDDENEPRGVNVIIETPKGSGHKYAWKETYGVIELRRILRGGMVWPCDFGFIPQTHADDGDAIDVALLIDEPCFPGCLVRARVLGSIGLIKNDDENDRLLWLSGFAFRRGFGLGRSARFERCVSAQNPRSRGVFARLPNL